MLFANKKIRLDRINIVLLQKKRLPQFFGSHIYVSPILKMGRHIVFARVVRPSVRPSVCLSVRPSVRLSVTNFAARVTQKP